MAVEKCFSISAINMAELICNPDQIMNKLVRLGREGDQCEGYQKGQHRVNMIKMHHICV